MSQAESSEAGKTATEAMSPAGRRGRAGLRDKAFFEVRAEEAGSPDRRRQLRSRILDGQRAEILDESGASVSNLLNESVNALTDPHSQPAEAEKVLLI